MGKAISNNYETASFANLNAVPSKNSTDNANMRDVIGQKTDDEDGNSIYSKLYIMSDHIHSAQKVYPTLAAGVVVTGGAGAWELGNYAEVVPINTITSLFDIHFLNVAAASASDTYEIVLYAATTEIGRCRVTRATGTASVAPVQFMTPLIAANSQIQAKVASSSGGDNVTISIYYHIY